MIQFYFLSVFLNALAGYILFSGDDGGVLEFKSDFSLKDETFKLIAGICTGVVGLLKLLSPIEGDIPIIGDLVPGVFGLLAGFILILEYYRNRTPMDETEKSETMNRILLGNKRIIGIAAIVVAILHFLLPKVLLL